MSERDDMTGDGRRAPRQSEAAGENKTPGGSAAPGGSTAPGENSLREGSGSPDQRPLQEEGAFTDERLLAFALGLDDDPELRAAAAGDAALRARLETVRADVDVIGAGLERVVPAPPDGYTDLGDQRWKRLRAHMEGRAAASSGPRRRPLWARVLAPAAVIAVVLVAGVIGLQRLSGSGTTHVQSATEQTTESFGDKTRAAEDGVLSGGATGGEGASHDRLLAAPDPSRYAAVVIARATRPEDLGQRFTVVRVLRDASGDLAVGDELKLVVVDRAVAAGRLVLLYLAPRATSSTPSGAQLSPVPAPTAAGAGAASIRYEYRGQDALALPLPPGTDPDTVELP